jgi:hypothetical protein
VEVFILVLPEDPMLTGRYRACVAKMRDRPIRYETDLTIAKQAPMTEWKVELVSEWPALR